MPDPQIEEVARSAATARGFAFEAWVAEGAFKETFRVRANDGTPYALKVYRPGASPQRTDREVEAIKRCTHANIAKLDSIGTQTAHGQNHVVSIEEFLDGGTLSDRLAGGPLSIDASRELGVSLIDAVAHVASHNFVHRDIKPDNIMFRDSAMTPVIVDFGLVRDLSQSSLTQSWILRGPGTPLFAAPEQLNNEKQLIDWRTDQFALGVVLSYAAFGFHPYQTPGLAPGDIVERVASRLPLSDQFSAAVRNTPLAALTRMVAAYPIQRFRKPQDLITAWNGSTP